MQRPTQPLLSCCDLVHIQQLIRLRPAVTRCGCCPLQGRRSFETLSTRAGVSTAHFALRCKASGCELMCSNFGSDDSSQLGHRCFASEHYSKQQIIFTLQSIHFIPSSCTVYCTSPHVHGCRPLDVCCKCKPHGCKSQRVTRTRYNYSISVKA